MVTWEYYQRVIDLLRNRGRAYRVIFNPQLGEAKIVLKDLATFCRARETVYHESEKMTYVLIGRQEVFRRIEQHLKLEPDDLYKLFDGREVTTAKPAPTEGYAEHE